jgi:outer membrane protein, heavy metal efflux system
MSFLSLTKYSMKSTKTFFIHSHIPPRIFLGVILTLCMQSVIADDFLSPTNAPKHSAEAAASSISIDDLVAEVLEKNPELHFYQAEIDAARGVRRTAAAMANPEASGQYGEKKVHSPDSTLKGEVWSASLSQTFEFPGRVTLRKHIADRQIELANLAFEQFRTALVNRTRTLAFILSGEQENAVEATDVSERFRSLRQVLEKRDHAGVTPLLETRIIEATELTLQRRTTEMKLAAQSMIHELNLLRGKPLQEPLVIKASTPRFPSTPSTELLLASAQTENPDLRMRQAELEQQGFKVSLAKNEMMPAVTVGPYYSEERAGDRETQVGLAVSMPLPFWNHNSGKIATEKAREQQALISFETTRQKVERQILETIFVYETKRKQIAEWGPNFKQQFKDAAAEADRSYRTGSVPLTIYLELQKQHLEALEAMLSTMRETLEAKQELERLTGVNLDELTAIKMKETK